MSNIDTARPSAPKLLAPGIGALDRARWMTHKLIDGLSDDELFAQPCAGANHAVWVIGHIAVTDDFFLSALGGEPSGVPESWNGLFGMNSEPSADRATYPRTDELLKVFEDRRAALKAWLGSRSESALLEPVEGDLAKFSATRAELPASLAFHEGFHAGQISVARRHGGKAPLF